MAKRKETCWLLTTAYAGYDQHGEYFIAWFPQKPPPEVVAPLLDAHVGLPRAMGEALSMTLRLLAGEPVGGRVKMVLREQPAGAPIARVTDGEEEDR